MTMLSAMLDHEILFPNKAPVHTIRAALVVVMVDFAVLTGLFHLVLVPLCRFLFHCQNHRGF